MLTSSNRKSKLCPNYNRWIFSLEYEVLMLMTSFMLIAFFTFSAKKKKIIRVEYFSYQSNWYRFNRYQRNWYMVLEINNIYPGVWVVNYSLYGGLDESKGVSNTISVLTTRCGKTNNLWRSLSLIECRENWDADPQHGLLATSICIFKGLTEDLI